MLTNPPMLNRHSLIAAHDSILQPYAVKHADGLGRLYEESGKTDDLRLRFAIDVGRIVHSKFYRDLDGKAQVYSAMSAQKLTTRGTHTSEVVFLSRSLARGLGLNEDLAEAIAAGHDLGHPPFGHKGEQALSAWMLQNGAETGFEHNQQTLRIVELLAGNRTQHRGLNLNLETLHGLDKHAARTEGDGHTLEAQMVNKADRISYLPRDIDDALRLGIISLADLRSQTLVNEAFDVGGANENRICSHLIHLLASDLQQETTRRIAAMGIETLEDVRHATEKIVEFSPERAVQVRGLVEFMYQMMYTSQDEKGYRQSVGVVIATLADYLRRHPSKAVKQFEQLSCQETPKLRRLEGVKDTIASMTDAEALKAVQTGPGIADRHVRRIQTIYGRKPKRTTATANVTHNDHYRNGANVDDPQSTA